MTSRIEHPVTGHVGNRASSQPPAPGMSRSLQKLCIWAGVPMLVLLLGGMLLAGFLFPPSPHATADQIARMYHDHTIRIRIGLTISFFGFIFLFPYGAAISTQTRRIQGAGRLLSYLQNSAVGSVSFVFILPWVLWLTAAYRPERPATEIQLLNDLGWTMFVFPLAAFCAWNWAIALAILTDQRKPAVYPRWVGYYNIFLGLTFIPDALVVFVKTGPLTWAGLITYYLPFVWFGIWMIAMMITTSRAIDADPQLTVDASDG
jgi:hypothetical protein